ncbi:MAG: TIR domain-containing protein, partial [Anaerolineales bacterium]|nr:TIR domain-containing protein [Anaerolineales bacterium]
GLLSSIVYIDLVDVPEAEAVHKLIAGVRQERVKPAVAPGFPGAIPPRSIQDQPDFPHAAERLDLEVMITYHSEDAGRARTLRNDLEQRGVRVWRDEENISAGAHFGIAIEQAIRRADAVVVLLTDKAAESLWVRNEIEYARGAGKPIFPLRLDAGAPPIINIMSLQYIDFCAGWATGLDRLAERLKELAAEKKIAPQVIEAAQTSSPFQARLEAPLAGANPFLYGSAIPVELFSGRASALAAIRNRVWNPWGLQSLSLVSNRRMGKTSLLNYVARKHASLFPADYTYVTVYIDAMDARARTIAGVMRLLRRGIARQLQRDLWPEPQDGNLDVMSDAFEELVEEPDIRLVLLLDEFESVMAFRELDPLLKNLRSCGSQARIGMITATAHKLSDLEQQSGLVSNFYNIFFTEYLGNLPTEEWQALVRQAYARSGREVTPAVLAQVGQLAGGHPYLTQLAGALHWQAPECGWSPAEIAQKYAAQARMIFTDLWQRLVPEQVQALRYALGTPGVVEAPLNVTNDLKARGVLTESGAIFCQPFADFILQEAS